MPFEGSIDPEVHLCFGDIRVDSHENPSMLQVVIKCSKMDLYRLKMTLYIGITNSELCPILAVMDYMLARDPLFMWQDSRYLTCDCFVQVVRKALTTAEIEAKNYAGHSFRIGAATTAAQCGLQESTIKMLGRWPSSAYLLYIKTH